MLLDRKVVAIKNNVGLISKGFAKAQLLVIIVTIADIDEERMQYTVK